MTNSRIFIICFILMFISGWFYWFQYRPSEIKKECYQQRKKLADKIDSDLTEKGMALSRSDNVYLSKRLEQEYQLCLHSKGL